MMYPPWPFATWREFAAIVAVGVAVIAVAAVILVKFPYPLSALSNWGFGPEWNCTYSGRGDPVCIKRPPPS